MMMNELVTNELVDGLKREKARRAKENGPLHVWIRIDEGPGANPVSTMRMRVPTGWLYRLHGADAMVFVPDRAEPAVHRLDIAG